MAHETSSKATYFVTTATRDRFPSFRQPETARLFLETLRHYRETGCYLLHAYVVMPDHIHLLLTPQEITIECAVGRIKGGFSRKVGWKGAFWQEGFHERRIRDAEEFLARRKYIHQNPVRARLVDHEGEYRWSSAYSPSGAEAPGRNGA